jgi:hypothetical protein
MVEISTQDLDAEGPAGSGKVIIPSSTLPQPQEKNETVDERTRRTVSYWLLGLLTLLLVTAFVATFIINEGDGAFSGKIWIPDAAGQSEFFLKVLNIVFGPVVTLVSSVVGFYFGARTANESKAG